MMISPTVQDHLMKAQFSGTLEEFALFYKTLESLQISNEELVSFTFEVSDENQFLIEKHNQLDWLDGEDFEENHVLHPSNRAWLLEKLDEAEADIDAGKVIPATPEFFQNIISEGRARLEAQKK